MDVSDMPGPTDEARALQLKQYAVYDRIGTVWDTLASQLGRDNHEAIRMYPEYLQVLADYDASVAELEALLGPDAHCNHVDSELWSLFSDCYKSEAGFRPRMHVTRAQAQAYFKTLSPAVAPD